MTTPPFFTVRKPDSWGLLARNGVGLILNQDQLCNAWQSSARPGGFELVIVIWLAAAPSSVLIGLLDMMRVTQRLEVVVVERQLRVFSHRLDVVDFACGPVAFGPLAQWIILKLDAPQPALLSCAADLRTR
jgi:hypothetical protein